VCQEQFSSRKPSFFKRTGRLRKFQSTMSQRALCAWLRFEALLSGQHGSNGQVR